jgi:hypothetical protein
MVSHSTSASYCPDQELLSYAVKPIAEPVAILSGKAHHEEWFTALRTK